MGTTLLRSILTKHNDNISAAYLTLLRELYVRIVRNKVAKILKNQQHIIHVFLAQSKLTGIRIINGKIGSSPQTLKFFEQPGFYFQ